MRQVSAAAGFTVGGAIRGASGAAARLPNTVVENFRGDASGGRQVLLTLQLLGWTKLKLDLAAPRRLFGNVSVESNLCCS